MTPKAFRSLTYGQTIWHDHNNYRTVEGRFRGEPDTGGIWTKEYGGALIYVTQAHQWHIKRPDAAKPAPITTPTTPRDNYLCAGWGFIVGDRSFPIKLKTGDGEVATTAVPIENTQMPGFVFALHATLKSEGRWSISEWTTGVSGVNRCEYWDDACNLFSARLFAQGWTPEKFGRMLVDYAVINERPEGTGPAPVSPVETPNQG